MKKGSGKKAIETVFAVENSTGLYDKISFDNMLSNEIIRASRNNSCITLAIINVDQYNIIKKTCNKAREDAIMKSIAKTIKNNVRSYFNVGRYSNNEFAIILPDTVKGSAISILRIIRKKVSQTIYRDSKNKRLQVTLSMGIANYPENALNKSNLTERTKSALAIAKKEHGNRVIPYVTTSKTSIKLAVCYSGQSQFYSNVLLGMREIIEDAGNIDLKIYYIGQTPDDFKKPGSGIRKAIADKPDIIAISSKANIGPYVKMANKAKIRVFGFNLLDFQMNPKAKIDTCVGYDYRKLGQKVGEYIARVLRGEGKIALIEGIKNASDSVDIKRGANDILKKYKKIHVVESISAEWKRNKAQVIAKNIMRKHSNLDVIFGLNDEMALGSIQAVVDKGRIGKTLVIGLDGTMSGLNAIKDGKLAATLNVNPIALGILLMRTILRSMVKEEKVPRIIESQTVMVDPVNIDMYLR